ncbi:uracil-DNA glycosylase [uncultured Ornithinimicrobium sp.]|uniref:uracil-DNA glycosylase n=1 Tax=uncultured Ornithinimicrobium sp. TaxID=259307 RepID=UPI0025919BCE|nr:uracil-DNA glycosylase [uncultured Ornithinimicrobium sp.]
MQVPGDWSTVLGEEFGKSYWRDLLNNVQRERQSYAVYPPEDQVFTAFRLTSYADTKVVILGQDPYHQAGQAHGLAFSVPAGVRIPPSLCKIQQEMCSDIGIERPIHGNLDSWARQGVLLLNATLTVRDSDPNQHHGRGWERFTDRVISMVNEKPTPVVFMLWGGSARAKKALIDTGRHRVIEAAHPAARANARDPFLGSRPFSRANRFLEDTGQVPIDWTSVCRPTDVAGS